MIRKLNAYDEGQMKKLACQSGLLEPVARFGDVVARTGRRIGSYRAHSFSKLRAKNSTSAGARVCTTNSSLRVNPACVQFAVPNSATFSSITVAWKKLKNLIIIQRIHEKIFYKKIQQKQRIKFNSNIILYQMQNSNSK